MKQGRKNAALQLSVAVGVALGLAGGASLIRTHLESRNSPPTVPKSAEGTRAAVSGRPRYPLSVVSGGTHSVAEAERARQTDPVVADHYRDVNVAELKPIHLQKKLRRYVSYRRNGKVFWTRNPVTLKEGELVLAGSEAEIRTRCGNRISERPRTPVAKSVADEPTEALLDAPEVQSLTASMDLLVLPPLPGPPDAGRTEAVAVLPSASEFLRGPASLTSGGGIGRSGGGSGAPGGGGFILRSPAPSTNPDGSPLKERLDIDATLTTPFPTLPGVLPPAPPLTTLSQAVVIIWTPPGPGGSVPLPFTGVRSLPSGRAVPDAPSAPLRETAPPVDSAPTPPVEIPGSRPPATQSIPPFTPGTPITQPPGTPFEQSIPEPGTVAGVSAGLVAGFFISRIRSAGRKD